MQKYDDVESKYEDSQPEYYPSCVGLLLHWLDEVSKADEFECCKRKYQFVQSIHSLFEPSELWWYFMNVYRVRKV